MGDKTTKPGLYLAVVCGRGTEDNELAASLRGGPVFDVLEARLATYGVKVMQSQPSADSAQTLIPIPPRAYADQVSFIDLDRVVDALDIWGQLVERTLTIVDVHFPLGSPMRIQAVQSGRNEKTRDRARDAEAQDRWDDPERLARAAKILAEAAVVVSPRREWAKLLEQWYPGQIRVQVLPDVVSAETGGQFIVRLTESVELGLLRRAGSLSIWQWAKTSAFRLFARAMRRSIRREMINDLAEVDFSYAEVSGE